MSIDEMYQELEDQLVLETANGIVDTNSYDDYSYEIEVEYTNEH